MYVKVSIFMLAFLPLLGFADWSHIDKVDDFTDESIKYAVHISPHHDIQVSRENGSVWMFITRKDIGTIEPDGIIEYRVDKNGTREVDLAGLSERWGNTFFSWEPRTVGFLIWHGQEKFDYVGQDCGFVSQLLSGQNLKFRYQVNSLERESFKISLNGAKEAIVKGLGLKICGL